MKHTFAIFTSMLLFQCAALSVMAAELKDWPQFRGPNADGHVKGQTSPLEWSDSKNVAWKVAIPGLGWSSPSLVQGKIFLTTAVPIGEGLSLRAMALDAKTGKTIWDREIRAVAKAPKIHSKNSHASPTPVIRDGSVYVHFGALGMASLAVEDGAIQWTNFELDYPPVHGSGGSPVYHEGKLVIVCDGSTKPFVAAVDAKTGKVAWKQLRSVVGKINHSFVTPTVAVIDGKAQVMAPGPDHFAAYDLETGTELWRVKAPGWSVVPQPAIGHGLVIYNHDYDNPELLAGMDSGQIWRWYKTWSKQNPYNYEQHVAFNEAVGDRLPATFMVMPPEAPAEYEDSVWTDILFMRTFNMSQARKRVEKHVCPLPMDIVKRLINRFSMEGETILDPFTGIGTVPALAVELGRKGLGTELNPMYYEAAIGYCEDAEIKASSPSLFDLMAAD